MTALAAFASAGVAMAQTADTPPPPKKDATTVGEVVVTGQRAAIRSAQAIKKNADQIVDSITATDIGALPDRSVTEALQRIVGVTITRMEDPRDTQRVSVEGAGVQIRGLSYVESLLDGRDSFSAKNGRSLSFDDIPPELFAGVDVYKNPSAELIEGGVGGTVDLRTRMPFDQQGHIIAFSADANYGDLVNTWKPSGSLLLSDRWHTPIGEIGLLVDVSDSKFTSRTDTESVDPWFGRSTSTNSCYTGPDANGNPTYAPVMPNAPTTHGCVFVPGGFGYRSLIFNRERQGIDIAAQWRPTDTLLVSAKFLRSASYSNESEHAVGEDPDSATSFYPAAGSPNFVYNTQGYFQSGTFASSQGGSTDPASVLDERYNTTHSVTSDYSINIKWRPTAKLSLSADVQYISSSTKATDFTVFDLPSQNSPSGSSSFPASYMNLTGNLPVFNIPLAPGVATNPADYTWNAAMDYHDRNNADEWAERIDGSYTFDGDWLKDFRFGVRHTDKDAVTRETNYNWGYISQSWAGAGQTLLNGTTVAPSWAGGAVVPGVTNAIPSAPMPFANFFGGQVPLAANFLASTSAFVANFTNASKVIVAAENNNGGWQPFNGNYNAYTAVGGASGVNTQREETWAEFGTLRVAHDLSIFGLTVPTDANLGVRVTETTASGTGTEIYNALANGTTAAYPTSNLAFSNGTSTSLTGGRSYPSVLPSLNVRFKFTPTLYLRLAYAKSIVRPTFAQMQPTINISATPGYNYPPVTATGCQKSITQPANPLPQYLNNCVYQYTAYEGNPDLKPIRANSYDAALEWYFAKAGSLTGTIFYKDLYNWITTGSTVQNFTNNGVTEPVLVNQPYNAGHGTIKGLELTYQQYFDFLPWVFKGIGVQANYTLIDSAGGRNASADPYDPTQIGNAQNSSGTPANPALPLEGISRNSYNLALLYDHGPVSFRLAYNWREKYLLTTSAANLNIPAWADNFGQLDASLFYSVTKNVKVGVQAANIAGAIYRTSVSYPSNYIGLNPGMTGNTWVDADRRVSLILRGTF